MVYRPPDIKLLATNDMAHKRRLLIRVERSALQFIMGREDPYWAYYHGADAGQFVTDIAALTGPSEKCFKQQAEAAAAKQREAQEKAAIEFSESRPLSANDRRENCALSIDAAQRHAFFHSSLTTYSRGNSGTDP